MDRSDGAVCLLVAIIICITVSYCSFMGGWDKGTRVQQYLAIEANVGMWTIDPVTGKTEFKYGTVK